LLGVSIFSVSSELPLTLVSATPKTLLAVIPLGFFYFRTQNYFLRTSRELNHIISQSSGPVYTHLHTVYDGISTVRAFNHLDRFKQDMEEHIDAKQRACFANESIDAWLSIRLKVSSAIIATVVACLAISGVHSGSRISAAIIGVALVNTQRITMILKIQALSAAHLEAHLVALERVVEYAHLPVEGGKLCSKEPPSDWPQKGAITFHSYSTRYREELNDVLRNLNLTIEGGKKIGVVGRTGAGKSSLTLALYVF
jgi:ATP-binding cassette subfamily C (CFTR/MRP) protein 1